eukprot:TRINITY_DN11207_c0_g1_i1.p1 TRINITY_DN11207_c0_g1~~TRINITY_DN11207_c0_g1_i1.p1  ORF type:complete len:126 (+),score=7.42 TRINITY_DN11207_c0_g1_i1:69-446(+)
MLRSLVGSEMCIRDRLNILDVLVLVQEKNDNIKQEPRAAYSTINVVSTGDIAGEQTDHDGPITIARVRAATSHAEPTLRIPSRSAHRSDDLLLRPACLKQMGRASRDLLTWMIAPPASRSWSSKS